MRILWHDAAGSGLLAWKTLKFRFLNEILLAWNLLRSDVFFEWSEIKREIGIRGICTLSWRYLQSRIISKKSSSIRQISLGRKEPNKVLKMPRTDLNFSEYRRMLFLLLLLCQPFSPSLQSSSDFFTEAHVLHHSTLLSSYSALPSFNEQRGQNRPSATR